MNKVFCFGELLLRMSPALNREWINMAQLPVYVGGAELNTATALSNWNIPARYCTALPDNYLSHDITAYLQERKIDTSAIHFCGNRIGTYYLPPGADLKNAGVIYDRAYSSFSGLKPGMINWDAVLEGCSWFHWSAISPALNENTAAVCREALEAASAKKMIISVDLNFRSKLWQYGKQPAAVMSALLPYCHVVMGNIWAAEQLLNIESPIKESRHQSKEQMTAAAGASMKALHLAFPGVQTMAYTFRLDESYFAVLQHGADMKVSTELPLADVVDKAGSGDCFMGGLIYGLYHQHPAQDIINFAAAAATGKMKEKGDASRQTIESVLKILQRA
ncbi:MAG: sugar kinase [Chitinophagaceae bacterium]|nr:sugar kinase [Chitinophagaceae bacterium]